MPFATVVIGVVLVALSIWLLCGRELTLVLPRFLAERRLHHCCRCLATD
ncbi:hypothetical protein I540_5124 [Mycobacteroides abscessus subsp. bolletii 1513]|uniref:Uncharacterized protein n=1 Tax=Mycobacteroides abscessus subsp. bolletii 1513 TaxID=1299321 RepID=X8DFU2_9MYCO|nr:hypothetical protein I540_5124 [Mycobacteroides abscessus subsp. bolletii 1513]